MKNINKEIDEGASLTVTLDWVEGNGAFVSATLRRVDGTMICGGGKSAESAIGSLEADLHIDELTKATSPEISA